MTKSSWQLHSECTNISALFDLYISVNPILTNSIPRRSINTSALIHSWKHMWLLLKCEFSSYFILLVWIWVCSGVFTPYTEPKIALWLSCFASQFHTETLVSMRLSTSSARLWPSTPVRRRVAYIWCSCTFFISSPNVQMLATMGPQDGCLRTLL